MGGSPPCCDVPSFGVRGGEDMDVIQGVSALKVRRHVGFEVGMKPLTERGHA